MDMFYNSRCNSKWMFLDTIQRGHVLPEKDIPIEFTKVLPNWRLGGRSRGLEVSIREAWDCIERSIDSNVCTEKYYEENTSVFRARFVAAPMDLVSYAALAVSSLSY